MNIKPAFNMPPRSAPIAQFIDRHLAALAKAEDGGAQAALFFEALSQEALGLAGAVEDAVVLTRDPRQRASAVREIFINYFLSRPMGGLTEQEFRRLQARFPGASSPEPARPIVNVHNQVEPTPVQVSNYVDVPSMGPRTVELERDGKGKLTGARVLGGGR